MAMTDRYRALLVANSRYPRDPDNLPALEGPVNDVTLLRAVLQDPAVGLFDEDEVAIRAEWSSHELIGALDDFFTNADRSDVLLLYFSGHGRLDHTNTLYLCTTDTHTDRLRATAVSSNRLNEMIEASVAARTVIILDCCHSGAFKGGDLASPLAGAGRYVLASCRARELARDALRANHPSLFTANLVAGLRGAAPNRMRPDHLTLEELHTYIRDQLAATGSQRPQLVSRGDGGLAIAKRPAALAAPQLDPSPPRVAAPPTGPALMSAPPSTLSRVRSPLRPMNRWKRWWERRLLITSVIVTLVLIAWVGYQIYQRLIPLRLDRVTVELAEPLGDKCDVQAKVVGTIRTNGAAGSISYRWLTSDGKATSTLNERVNLGTSQVQLTMMVTFNGKGTTQTRATLHILTPREVQASTEFTYSCK
jgi:hypothetical protein